jgi:putative flippase GtrA
MLKKIWSVKLTRFLCVGISNTLLDLTILNSLVFLGHLPYLIANLISASISISSSYFLNHHLVFRSQDEHSLARFFHFFIVTGVGILGIQTLMIYLVKHLLSHHRSTVLSIVHDLPVVHLSVNAFDLNVGKLVAVVIAMGWNYTIYQFVIFSKHGEATDVDVLL